MANIIGIVESLRNGHICPFSYLMTTTNKKDKKKPNIKKEITYKDNKNRQMKDMANFIIRLIKKTKNERSEKKIVIFNIKVIPMEVIKAITNGVKNNKYIFIILLYVDFLILSTFISFHILLYNFRSLFTINCFSF